MRFFLVATLISSPLFAESDYLTQNLEQISKEILQHGDAYTNLSELTQLGPRLCGSEGAAKAIEWAQKKLESYKVDRVWLQPVSVPHWVPGNSAKAQIVLSQDPNFQPVNLAIAPLGNSPGAMGVEAEVIEVKSVQEVANLGEQARGKIIFLNSPMPILPNPFEAYSKTVGARTHGPNAAAKNGAVAALVRSVSTLIDDNPHAGVTIFDQKLKPIPAAALSTQAANQLSAILAQHQYKDKKVRIKLMFNSQKLPDVTSYNVIAELKGRELPNEVVVVGGHMDSWYL
ncbi:MAG: peptidase M28 family protein, partial [Pseudomonadota bacterium]